MKPLLALCLLLPFQLASAADTREYVILRQGKPAGYKTITKGDDGVYRSDYYFKNNGRGPETKEEFTLRPDGTFERFKVTGKTTFGSTVDESFVRTGDRVEWRSTSDRGEATVPGQALYWSLGGRNETGLAIDILSRTPSGRLPLIPNGSLSMRKVAEANVTSGKRSQTVQLLAFTGVGLTPFFEWATTGDKPRVFASISVGGSQTIEKGWETNAPALEVRQQQAEQDVLDDMQRRLAHKLDGATLIRNARVFDSEHARLRPASNVLVRDGRIVAIDAAADAAAAQVVDAGGRVLLPGLFDMHGHVGRWDGGLHLAAGVTTVRDMGNDNDDLQQMIAEQKAGRLLMPQIVPAGFIEGESPMSARMGFVIKDLESAKKAVDWYAAHGYPQVKIYNSFPKDILRETAAYAHAKGMRVSGHVPVFMRAEEVVQQGYDEIQHINQVMLNFLVDDKTDTRTLQRFYLPAEKTGTFDFDDKPMQDFIALLAEKQIVIDPTLSVHDILRHRTGKMSESFAAIADHLPPDVKRGFYAGSMDIPDDATEARYRASHDKLVEFVGRLYKAGVPIVAGTDDFAGFALHRELELYVQAGMTPQQALQVATWNGAKYSRVLDDRGSVAAGKRADLILVDGDPTTNISDIRKVALVITGTTAYYPSDIYDALGIQPFTTPVRVAMDANQGASMPAMAAVH
jgi:cytosine/adenosine deaminase-related metal-dependent hydrolase